MLVVGWAVGMTARLSIPLNGFNVPGKRNRRAITVYSNAWLSIPLNGFTDDTQKVVDFARMPFNSIEWIHIYFKRYVSPKLKMSFNSIEWILARHVSIDGFGSNVCWLSIPLNGFLVFQPRYILNVMSYFQFHWMDSTLLALIGPAQWYLLIFQFHWMDSGKSVYLSPACGRGVFQFHWMDS